MVFKKEDVKFFLGRKNRWVRSLYLDIYCLIKKFLKSQIKDNEIFIQRLYFEVTNICNLQCRYCIYSKKPPQKRGVMEFDVFKKAIDEFNELGGKVVSFTPTIGEPLLDPGLTQKVKYALSLPSIEKVYFYTNGTLLLRNDNYKSLIDTGINDIEISISACDADTFKEIHGANLYEQTIEGIYKLLQYNAMNGERAKIGINFRSSVLPSKILDSKDFQKYIKPFLSPKVVYTFMSTYDNWGGNITKNDLIGLMKLKRVNKFKYLPCVRMYDVAVLFDGSIRLCACRIKDSEFDELVVGNIKHSSLKEIFYSQKAKKIRNSFFSGVAPPVCKNCSLYIPVTKKFISGHKKLSPLPRTSLQLIQ